MARPPKDSQLNIRINSNDVAAAQNKADARQEVLSEEIRKWIVDVYTELPDKPAKAIVTRHASGPQDGLTVG